MRGTASRPFLGGVAVAASLAVTLVLASCGGGSDSAGGGAASTEAGKSQVGSGGPAGASAASIETFGEAASTRDRAAATQTVQQFLSARADGDWARACSLVAPSVISNLRAFLTVNPQLSGRGCPVLMRAVAASIPAQARAAGKQVQGTGVRVQGDRGYVLYRDSDGSNWAFPVLRESSVWKVAAVVGPRLP